MTSLTRNSGHGHSIDILTGVCPEIALLIVSKIWPAIFRLSQNLACAKYFHI